MQGEGQIHIGTSGWHYKNWLGPFYPKHLKSRGVVFTEACEVPRLQDVKDLRERDMHTPLSIFLENQGYRVNCEVKGCDITAVKGGELVIVEMKKSFSLRHLYQGVKRKELTDSVYLALAVPPGKSIIPNFSDVKILLRRLELGLILVRFMKMKTKVEVVLHPLPFHPQKRRKKRAAIIREIDGRFHEFNTAGIPSKEETITTYKLQAITIAYLLGQSKKASPKELRAAGGGEKTQEILSKNVYGWFQRVERGIYTLHSAGRKALKHYKHIIGRVKEELGKPHEEDPR